MADDIEAAGHTAESVRAHRLCAKILENIVEIVDEVDSSNIFFDPQC
jgi:hypothetical protein